MAGLYPNGAYMPPAAPALPGMRAPVAPAAPMAPAAPRPYGAYPYAPSAARPYGAMPAAYGVNPAAAGSPIPAGMQATFASPTSYGAASVDGGSLVRLASPAAAEMVTQRSAFQAVSRAAVRMRYAASEVPLGKALGLGFLVTAPLVAIMDYMAFRDGKITAAQRNTLIAADIAGYTVAGAAGSWLGATLAMGAMGPVGSLVGIVAGVALGYVYERHLRPQFAAPAPTSLPPAPPPGEAL